MERNINILPLSSVQNGVGIVVVIDVLRAFSTAAYAFAAGVKEIITVTEVEQAFKLHSEFTPSLLMGEVGGLKVQGFDFGNSPSEILNCQNLRGLTLIQRTSAGTQGLNGAVRASQIMAAGFCNASTTAEYICRSSSESEIYFISSGSHTPDKGEEDTACAEFIIELLYGRKPDPTTFLERAAHSFAAQKFQDPLQHDFPMKDLELCLSNDRFNFAMLASRSNTNTFLRPIYI
jgi:2-phosphosulfolactate phosphatase